MTPPHCAEMLWAAGTFGVVNHSNNDWWYTRHIPCITSWLPDFSPQVNLFFLYEILKTEMLFLPLSAGL
jgi:hypothetical protein